jgi:NADH dehydrogenase FAD-containing subunit
MDQATKHLLLIGAGHAHVHFLRLWAEKPCPGWRVTLLSPYSHHTHSAMLPGYVAGHYTAADCQVDLAPLVKEAKVDWIQGHCVGLQTLKNQVEYALSTRPDGVPSKLRFDTLSIEAGSSIDRRRLEGQMPGATSYALSLRPVEVFVGLWPKVIDLARQKPPSMVVIGSGVVAAEIVFAAEQSMRLYGVTGARFSLVTGPGEWLPGVHEDVRQRVVAQLRERHISLIHATCSAIGDEALELGSQATLACDVPILAMDGQAPLWLQNSGLALSPNGQALTTPQQRSVEFEHVFIVGEASARQDQPDNREVANSLEARDTLAHNLWASLAGTALKKHNPPNHAPNTISCGPGHTIARWRRWTLEGGFAWWWKSRQDRAVMQAYRKPIPQPKAKEPDPSGAAAG